MPDLWDTNPDNVFRTAQEEPHRRLPVTQTTTPGR
jgi:hypothetical protein